MKPGSPEWGRVVTEPGIYDGMPDEFYHADPVPGGSLSTSGAKTLVTKSPAHYAYEREHGRPDKPHFDFGHAAHLEVLGRGLPVEVIEGDWRTKGPAAAVKAAREAGRVPLHREEHERILGMAAAIKAHPLAPILFSDGKAEQSAFWRDADSGVWRRARFDWLPGVRTKSGRLIIPDYKTTITAHPREWGKKSADFGYHMQADAYTEAAQACGLGDEVVLVFVAQEKEPPYVVSVFQLDADAMRIGNYLNRKAIDLYAECTRLGRWPGYSTAVEQVSLPGWYLNQHEDAL